MDILNNLEWYLDDPKSAKKRDNRKKLTKKDLQTIVFDDSVSENVKFCLPLHNDFKFSETRELPRPITVEQVLKLISKFYKESLKAENVDKAFEGYEELKEEKIEEYDGDESELVNYDVFTTDCATPDFCGLNYMDSGENAGEYFVAIGPE